MASKKKKKRPECTGVRAVKCRPPCANCYGPRTLETTVEIIQEEAVVVLMRGTTSIYMTRADDYVLLEAFDRTWERPEQLAVVPMELVQYVATVLMHFSGATDDHAMGWLQSQGLGAIVVPRIDGTKR